MALDAMDILATWGAIETRREDLVIRTVVAVLMKKMGVERLELTEFDLQEAISDHEITVDPSPGTGHALVYTLTRK